MARIPTGDSAEGYKPARRLSIRERADTGISVTSQAVKDEMRREDSFIASVKQTLRAYKPGQVRSIPGRDKLLP